MAWFTPCAVQHLAVWARGRSGFICPMKQRIDFVRQETL